jgi:chitodextrinase
VGGNLVWNEWFAGTIDEVRVYDRALSASEVQSDMADPVGTPPPGDTQAPTTPGNFRSPSATGSSVSLAWSASTDDTGVTEYAVYRGGNLVGTGLGTTRTVSGLACGTTYSFAVDAADAAGNRSAQATLNAATADCPTGPDTEAPTTPTGLAKTGSTQSSVSVSWSPSSDNVGVSAYGAYRSGTQVASPTGSTYTFTGLTCGTTYTLAVDAADAAGNRSAQATLNAATAACPPPPDTQAPTTPTGLAKTGSTQSSISVSWSPSSDDVGVTAYGAYRDGAPIATPTGTAYTFTGLACGTTYALAVDAADAAGNRSAQATLNASTNACPPPPDGEAPTTPGNFRSTGATTTSVSLAWNAATDNTGVTGYGVYRNGNLVSSPTGLTATVSGLSCGTSYTFGVDAVDAAGNRSPQASVSASTTSCPPAGGADLFVAPGGSDSGSCTQGNPCGSLNRAYAVASLGQTVEVAGGTYSGQTIDQTPKTGTGTVLFRPAAGASVVLGSITVHRAAHIEFRDFTVTSSTLNRQQASWITYRGITMRQFLVRSADHISYIDSEVGPNGSNDGMNWITAAYETTDPATDVLLDNVRIHDFTKHNSGAHVDCIGIDDVDGLVIRNSRLWNCEHFSIIFGDDNSSGRAARNALLENNFFDCCYSGYYSLGFGGVDGPMTVRFNSMTLGMGWLGGSVEGLTLDSNVVSGNNSANCSEATWRYNVVASGSSCGGGGVVAPTGFVGEPDDLHLTAGAAAINLGNPTAYPATDIDGQARGGNRPDAGADERG